ncbi:hypothetical protein GOODEAATRI_005812, partial [Goodea atripinnis]
VRLSASRGGTCEARENVAELPQIRRFLRKKGAWIQMFVSLPAAAGTLINSP